MGTGSVGIGPGYTLTAVVCHGDASSLPREIFCWAGEARPGPGLGHFWATFLLTLGHSRAKGLRLVVVHLSA